ncbi:MAG: hypothetical protein R8K20_01030, partial [Gallionellaceae bacterium]
PAEHGELKTLLTQLQTLIDTLPECEKAKALTETQSIAEAVSRPEVEQKNIVRQTLRYFKGLADDLGELPEIAIKLGKTIGKIALLFGL